MPHHEVLEAMLIHRVGRNRHRPWGQAVLEGPTAVVHEAAKGSAKMLNYLASELSSSISKLVPQRVPGTLNKEADWLSRLRGDMPPALASIKLRRATAINERQLETQPPGVESSPWQAPLLPHPSAVYDSL